MSRRTIVDHTAEPVYVHSVYIKDRDFLFLDYSFSSQKMKEYIELEERRQTVFNNVSTYIRSLTPDEKRIHFMNWKSQPEQDWVFDITELLPFHEYHNDGSIRKKKLKKRMEVKYPLFSDELEQRTLSDDPDYYSGNAECDRIKAVGRNVFTDEYWDAYQKAMDRDLRFE